MKKLYSPRNEIELSLIRGILEGEDIPHFIHNYHFGSLRAGPQIELFNARTIMVADDSLDRASELLSDFLKNIEPESTTRKSEYSLLDKLRMLLEVRFFLAGLCPVKSGRERN